MSQYILNNAFFPITSSIGFLECDMTAVRERYVDWMGPIQTTRGVSLKVRSMSGTLADKLGTLLPLTSIEARRCLFIPTQSRWVAYFDSGHRGTDAASAMSVLSSIISCQSLRVVSAPNVPPKGSSIRGAYGSTMLEVYGPDRPGAIGNHVRSIYCANDGGKWKFGITGEAQPFEEPEKYEAARLRDRFTDEMLHAYLRRLDIDLLAEELNDGPDAILIERHGPTAPGLEPLTE